MSIGQPTLNETIGRLGKGGELRFWDIEELRAMPHFDKFVHHAAAHYRWVQPEHMGDLLALVANAFQAGINVGYEFRRVEPAPGDSGAGEKE